MPSLEGMLKKAGIDPYYLSPDTDTDAKKIGLELRLHYYWCLLGLFVTAFSMGLPLYGVKAYVTSVSDK
ncbi:hypothetical protein KIPB_016295, partial [Kipferlia bialata]|eukprot:g16295.t1